MRVGNKYLKTDKQTWQYICNICFERRGMCKCENNSYLGIDPNIIEHLQILHQKNYQTVGCCEGHIVTYQVPSGKIYTHLSATYISFDINSLADFEAEINKINQNLFIIVPFKGMEETRFQIIIPEKYGRGDKFEEFMKFKSKRLKLLKEIFLNMGARERKEPLIITNY